ncbi:6-phosphogluconate dehydrogenase [Mrakia frigida]|uniref:NAD(P)-dependent oxidoreductase n=1 Tax=Mrakia frigida TaxID=29902 RepID=UPI003FCC1366
MALARRSSSLAFIGLPNSLSSPMATNLFLRSTELAQHREGDLVVVEQDDGKFGVFMHELGMMGGGLGEATAKRVKRVGSGAEAATLSSTLITSLPSSSVLQSTYLLPPQSILTTLKGQSFPPSQHLPKGMHTLLIDTSTLDVEVFRSVARQMGEQTNGGTGMVDAPFLGGLSQAKTGRLQFLVGGTQPAFEAAQPLLNLMGNRVTHCGDSGAGLSVKVISSLITGINQIALSEGLLLGSRLGVDSKVLSSVITNSSAQSWSASANSPIPSLSPNPPSLNGFNGGHSTTEMLNEIKFALNAATSLGAPLPLGYSAAMLYENVCDEDVEGAVPGEMKGKGRKDFSVVYEWLKERADGGVESWGSEEGGGEQASK